MHSNSPLPPAVAPARVAPTYTLHGPIHAPGSGAGVVAYGPRAQVAAQPLLASLREAGLPVAVAPPLLLPPPSVAAPTLAQRARWAKLCLLQWAAYEHVLYMDADTMLYAPAALQAGWEALASGFHIVAVPSPRQGDDWLWHLSEAERDATAEEAGHVLQIQCGVLFVRCCSVTDMFFAQWRAEWLRWQGEDQGAFLRALARVPIRLWLLGSPFNGGAVVGHRWGLVRGE